MASLTDVFLNSGSDADLSHNPRENEQKQSEGLTLRDDGLVNQSFVPDEKSSQYPSVKLQRTHSQDSMASTDTYRSNTASDITVQVQPRPGNFVDDDDDDLWEGEDLQKSMPSHHFRSIRGLPSENVLKQGMRRTLRTRALKSRGSVRSRSLDATDDASSEILNEDEVIKDLDLTPEQFAELVKRRKSIKEMPTSIRRKRSMRENVAESAARKRKMRHISTWTHFKLTVAMGWQQFKDKSREVLYSIELWPSHLKLIHGMFGSGVQSYFLLLRWLFQLNLVILVLTLFFQFVPQISHEQSTDRNNASFEYWELITGEGWFANTELYYGAYTSDKISVGDDVSYSMPLAYLCVGGGYLLLCLVLLVYSMANSYRENYIYSGDEISFYITKVFCSWDYGITDKSAALLKQKSIFNELQEGIAEQNYQVKRTLSDKCNIFWLRILTNFIVLCLVAGAAYLINFSASRSLTDSDAVFTKMLLPLVVSTINFVLPIAFRIIASIEKYRSPRTAVNVSLARTMLMMLTTVVMVIVSLFVDIQRCRRGQDLVSPTESNCDPNIDKCWENYVGYAFYRLVIVDFVFLLLSAFFGEFLRRIVAVNILCCKETVGPPGFDISRNVIDLVYAQCLCWIGTFFSPLLPVINVIKLLVLFYVKRVSVVNNCRPSMRPFRAARMNLLFLFLLAASFALALIVVGYTIMSDKVTKPSELCGPFRNQDSMYQVVTSTVAGFPEWVQDAFSYLSSAGFIALLFCALGIIVYYHKMLKDSNEKKIKLLKEQIALAGRDKLYLIKRIKHGMGLRVEADGGPNM